MSFFKQFRSIISKTADTEQQGTARPNVPPAEPIERRSRKRLNSHKGRRVLIIDDSPTIVAVLKKTLHSAGCITMEAFDAEHGLEVVRQEKPDLVFLDIVLPGMNGFAALRLMRRDPTTQHIPVIMISGNEQATEQFYAKRIGADDFMKKPFSRFEVFGRMDSLVELKKLAAIRPAENAARQNIVRPTDQSGMSVAQPVVPHSAPPAAQANVQPNSHHVSQPISQPVPQAIPQPTPQPVPPPVAHPALPTAAQAAVPVASPVAPASAQTTAPQMAARPAPIPVRPEAQATQVTHQTQTDAPVAPAQRPVSPVAVSTPAITPLEARSQLTAMGLQYFNQEQFLAALQRNDKLAIELFIAGGGVDINV